MFEIAAPYPLLQTTSVLPDPEFSDQEALTVSLTRKVAVDGTRYTYVKRKNDRRKLKWAFRLTRNKALELRAFICAYFASKIRAIDHHGRTWIGNFTSNPFEFDTSDRSAPALTPMPRGEIVNIEIEFEGVAQ